MVKSQVSYNTEIERLITNIEKVIIGKRQEIVLSIAALLARGHVLLEDVPGVGKTMLVRALAKSIHAEFKRIQFTPDLLPSDVTGTSIYNPKELKFEFREGPLMANIVLADEINRTSPKTQSALLEAMEEGSITVDGDTKRLPEPFFVMATQNPVEYEGTFTLPEAQLDRFLLKLNMGYPSPAEELEVLTKTLGNEPISQLEPVFQLGEIVALQKKAMDTYVDDSIKNYIIEIVTETRNNSSIQLGVSPRGSIALMRASQAYAFIVGRDYVIPDDVKYLASFTLSHRILLKHEAKYAGVTARSIIEDMLQNVKVPIQKV